MSATQDITLSEELRTIEREFPRWHLFMSDEGRVWASTPASVYGGSGVTVDAQSTQRIRQVIAAEEHSWPVAA